MGDERASRAGRRAVVLGAIIAVLVVAGGCFALGRLTAPTRSGSYADGYTDGQLAGIAQGRLIEGSTSLPASAKSAYAAGYTDGRNDSFTLQFDGGWAVGVPYVVTVARASDGVTYRFSFREPMESKTFYYACDTAPACSRSQP